VWLDRRYRRHLGRRAHQRSKTIQILTVRIAETHHNSHERRRTTPHVPETFHLSCNNLQLAAESNGHSVAPNGRGHILHCTKCELRKLRETKDCEPVLLDLREPVTVQEHDVTLQMRGPFRARFTTNNPVFTVR